MYIPDRIEDGHYKTKLNYPRRVEEPAVLRKTAILLTEAEVATLMEVKAAFAEAKRLHAAAIKEVQADEARLKDEFRRDIEAAQNMTGHPKADLLWNKAWEAGHANGLNEVYNAYTDLAELVR